MVKRFLDKIKKPEEEDETPVVKESLSPFVLNKKQKLLLKGKQEKEKEE